MQALFFVEFVQRQRYRIVAIDGIRRALDLVGGVPLSVRQFAGDRGEMAYAPMTGHEEVANILCA